MDLLRTEVRSFWERDYERDVAQLNAALARRGRPTAGFEAAPPSVLTGNPFELTPGDCIGVIGLNPKWQPGMEESEEIRTGRDEHRSNGGFDRYVDRRSRYFLPGSTEFYGRYFSKLQNRLSDTMLAGEVADAASVFRTAAFKLDLLPWWSVDTSMINEAEVDTEIDAIRAWQRVIHAFIATLRPRAIVVNGCGMRRTASLLLRTPLLPFRYGPNRRLAYFGVVDRTPVLAHAQLNATGAPSSQGDYRSLVQTWREQLN